MRGVEPQAGSIIVPSPRVVVDDEQPTNPSTKTKCIRVIIASLTNGGSINIEATELSQILEIMAKRRRSGDSIASFWDEGPKGRNQTRSTTPHAMTGLHLAIARFAGMKP